MVVYRNTRKLFVLLCVGLLLATLAKADSRRRRRDYDDDLDDDEDYGSGSRYGSPDPMPQARADRRQSEMASNALGDPTIAEQIANVATMVPLADYFKLPIRILKLGAFCDQMTEWLRQDVGVKAPMDKVALTVLFIVSSYLPALLASLIYAMTCKKEEKPRFDPSLFVYNRPDAAEMAKVLVTVGKIQETVSKLQESANGGSPGGSSSAAQTEQLIRDTQSQLISLERNLEAMQIRQDQQSQKLSEMDKRISKNFSVMFDALSKKIDQASFAATTGSPNQEGPTTSMPTTKANPTKKVATQPQVCGGPQSMQSITPQQPIQKEETMATPNPDAAAAEEEEDEEYYDEEEEVDAV